MVHRVAEVMGMGPVQETALGKSPQTVKAGALLCFWAHRKPGESTVEIARKPSISQSCGENGRKARKGKTV